MPNKQKNFSRYFVELHRITGDFRTGCINDRAVFSYIAEISASQPGRIVAEIGIFKLRRPGFPVCLLDDCYMKLVITSANGTVKAEGCYTYPNDQFTYMYDFATPEDALHVLASSAKSFLKTARTFNWKDAYYRKFDANETTQGLIAEREIGFFFNPECMEVAI